MTTTVLPMQACLACGHRMDRHAHMTKAGHEKPATPQPGDVTLCIKCGFVMMYDNELKFRTLTKAEMADVMQDERVQRAIVAIAELDGKSKQ